MQSKTFEQELTELINRYSMENKSNTPDFILMDFMRHSLAVFNRAIKLRDNWYGGKPQMFLEEGKCSETWKVDENN